MTIQDRFSARWRARQDRKLLKEARPPKEKIRSRLARWLKPKAEAELEPLTLTRAQRRQALRAAGPAARAIRLHTHMRRPLLATRCRIRTHPDQYRTHRPDKRRLLWLMRRHLRSLEREEAAA